MSCDIWICLECGRGAASRCPPFESLFAPVIASPSNLSTAGSGKLTRQSHRNRSSHRQPSENITPLLCYVETESWLDGSHVSRRNIASIEHPVTEYIQHVG
jgi:hypothetical protein